MPLASLSTHTHHCALPLHRIPEGCWAACHSPLLLHTHTPLRPFLPPPHSPYLLAPLAGLRAGGAAAGHEAERTYRPPPPTHTHTLLVTYSKRDPPSSARRAIPPQPRKTARRVVPLPLRARRLPREAAGRAVLAFSPASQSAPPSQQPPGSQAPVRSVPQSVCGGCGVWYVRGHLSLSSHQGQFNSKLKDRVSGIIQRNQHMNGDRKMNNNKRAPPLVMRKEGQIPPFAFF